MHKKNVITSIFHIYVGILVGGIILLLLNINMISVIHAKESELLPVVKYETYSSFEIIFLYLFIVLTGINIISMKFNKLRGKIPYINILTPLISIILIVTLFLNPHYLIIIPTGLLPTRLDVLEIGGILSSILFSILVANSVINLLIEKEITRILKILCIIIGGLLLSEFLHECGHAFFVLVSGGLITAFFPFPIIIDGEFTAGFVGYTNVPPDLEPLVLMGGEIFQWIAVLIILTYIIFKPKYRKNLFLMVLLLVALLDFPLYTINNSIGLPHWFFIGSINGDVMRFSILTGFPSCILIILSCLQLSITCLIFFKLKYTSIRNNQVDSH
ncbi:MAG: hypothetical protein ACFFE5_09715 [Candidatus Thorarchaeota archaeon]